MRKELEKVFSGKRILITGHTGFKGSWLSIWLKRLGAKVLGYSLPPPTTPNLFTLADVKDSIFSSFGDIRDFQRLLEVIQNQKPEIIFHLAAQPLVLESFKDPVSTFSSNVMGTVNLLEACKNSPFIKAVIIVTTDKCYENKEWDFGYRENDPLGGKDPYSASKAMAEMAAASYRCSFFSHATASIATARAGNVIGGGDFSSFRLIPDCMQALLSNEPIELRNPASTRPWMHVLDPLHGYIILAKKLLEEGQKYAESWNFGPYEQSAISCLEIVNKTIEIWGGGNWIDKSSQHLYPEMKMLQLNWTKAANRLKWRPLYDWKESVHATVQWFKMYEQYCQNPNSVSLQNFCITQIDAFMEKSGA